MSKLNLFLVFMTLLGIFATTVCGIWISIGPNPYTGSDIAFHTVVGGVTIFFTVLMMIKLLKQPQ
ncbi:MAG: hypothetical protein ACXAEF_01270 [Candidatus Thorarchaeota archaeon]|jgi:hypothetical protein